MKKLLILLPIFLLAGCLETAVPVTQVFPDVPDDLKQACPDLALVDPNTSKLSDVITVVSGNCEEYKECKIKVDLWIDWYTKQKQIYNSVK